MSQRLEPGELDYWDQYARSLPQELRPVEPRVTAGPAGPWAVTDELIALYLSGRKTAGSSLVADFASHGDPLPEVGDFWICLDGRATPRCILRTAWVERHTFRDVPASVALAEGEGDGSLEHWRRVHTDLYAPHLSSWGLERIEDAEVVTEFFTVVHTDPAGGGRSYPVDPSR